MTLEARARTCGDDELVAAVRAGDDRAFEQLYRRYRRRIGAYVQGMVGDRGRTEDVCQEVFMSALRRMRQTERPIAFRPWVYEIAKNAAIDHFRRSRRTEEVSFDSDEGVRAMAPGRLADRVVTPESAVARKQDLADLTGAFRCLSSNQHRILVLRELEGLSYREIGERMGLSRPSVESTLFRARRRLNEEYEELATGERCRRVQSLCVTAAEQALGVRDRRRLARHIAHCEPCRRHAHLLGVDAGRRSAAARLAGLLPLPGLLRPGRPGRGGSPGALGASGKMVATLGQWSTGLAGAAASIAPGWRALAAGAAVGVTGAGVGVATLPHSLGGPDQAAAHPVRFAPATARDGARQAASAAPTGGRFAPAMTRGPTSPGEGADAIPAAHAAPTAISGAVVDSQPGSISVDGRGVALHAAPGITAALLHVMAVSPPVVSPKPSGAGIDGVVPASRHLSMPSVGSLPSARAVSGPLRSVVRSSGPTVVGHVRSSRRAPSRGTAHDRPTARAPAAHRDGSADRSASSTGHHDRSAGRPTRPSARHVRLTFRSTRSRPGHAHSTSGHRARSGTSGSDASESDWRDAS